MIAPKNNNAADLAGARRRSDTNQNRSVDSTAHSVVAVKANGKRVIVGTCPTKAAAENWAALLRKYGRIAGTDAYVVPAKRAAA